MKIEMPSWLTDVPKERQAAERTRFLLRIAALYVDKDGSLPALSRACNLRENTLATIVGRQGLLSPELAIAVENCVGREVMTRELLRPDLFVIGG